MSSPSRHERLVQEHAILSKLREASTILEFQSSGEPPDRYTFTFRGKSFCRAGAARGNVETCQLQRCELRLPFAYPDQPPDARWLTPILHPNISYSGFLSWREIGLEWTPDISLDVVCERLWDVARLAYVNHDSVINHSAESWLVDHNRLPLPLDARPLRDIAPLSNPNIVRYARRDGQPLVLPVASPPAEVLFIDEDTPIPAPLPQRRDDDILFIGDE